MLFEHGPQGLKIIGGRGCQVCLQGVRLEPGWLADGIPHPQSILSCQPGVYMGISFRKIEFTLPMLLPSGCLSNRYGVIQLERESWKGKACNSF